MPKPSPTPHAPLSRPLSRPLTLGQLARATGLARASLLHYEALGLLLPAGRSQAGYRLYGPREVERLAAIRGFREAGLSLADIAGLLAGTQTARGPAALLEARLLALSEDIQRLHRQQRQLARLLAQPELRSGRLARGTAPWVALLREAGFSEADMAQWHRDFEQEAPADHQGFLAALGLSAAEIAAIRREAATPAQGTEKPGANPERPEKTS